MFGYCVILQKYPLEIIDKYSEQIEKYIKSALVDPTQETREIAKQCLRKYKEIFLK